MNLRALVELMATISSHSPNLIETGTKIPLDAVQRYWSLSRARTRMWLGRLTDFPAEIATASPERQQILRQGLLPLLADVLAGDLVERVWGAVLSAGDLVRGVPYGEPIATSVLIQQEHVRNRALKLMIENPGIPPEEAVPLDRLRRRLERWTDLLVGHLVRNYGLEEFAFDTQRALDFGEEQIADSWGTGVVQVWDLYLVSLRGAFPEAALPGGRAGELREGIARSMLAAFPPEVFLESGPLQSVGLRRMLVGGVVPAIPRLLPRRRRSSGSGRISREP